jgi:gliding motility-associated-like protein
MYSVLRYLLICSLCVAWCFRLQASHIVGGDLTYKHIVNDSFEITLMLYVDCVNGNPGAISEDATAVVAAFDPSGSMVKMLVAARSLPVRINSSNMECVAPPANACVDQYTYTYRTSLPFITGGYVLAFQRCCRNNTLRNIVNPQTTGTTFWCTVPDSVWSSGYNTSAVFKSLPPNFLCTNVLLSYDHSAADADGDSLTYELYTPYAGASDFAPRPVPPFNPPYVNITWAAGYNTAAMMKGNPQLAIDPVTGHLEVLPTEPGQYVVGIAVKEFRNGMLINISRRDFQFNVSDCMKLVTSIFDRDTTCSDTVRFVNMSTGATDYVWNFGDPRAAVNTSTAAEPEHIYGTTGIYTVKLLATNGNCRDSTEADITVDTEPGIFAMKDTISCKGQPVRLTTTNPVYFVYSWSPPDYLDDPAAPDPVSRPLSSVSYVVSRAAGRCVNTDTVHITVPAPEATFVPGFIQQCRNVLLTLDSVSIYPVMQWEYNDIPVSQEQLLAKAYNYREPIRIRLVVSDTHCYDTLYKDTVADDSMIMDEIPNVFSPNGDGINDCYRIGSVVLNAECSRLVVYNRWGRKVYDSDTDGACWSGNDKGDLLAAGVYYYILQHKSRDYHGTITLLR